MTDVPATTPPENYDAQAAALCLALKAKGAILIVFDGNKGTGISVHLRDRETMESVPRLLREMASKMERDLVFSRAQGKG